MQKNDVFRALRRRVGKAVRRHRAACCLTQEELAVRASMGWRHVQKIEAGEVNVTLRTLSKLATALSTDPLELLVAGSAD